MSESSNLQYWPEGIAAARIPANNNVRLLQALFLNPAISATTAAQPGSPTEGDVYILPAAPSGAQWASFFEDDVVIYYDATWTAYIPNDGLRKFVEDEAEDWQFVVGSSGGWAAAGGGGGGGSPGGADKNIQYNDGGAFGGKAGFEYDKTTNTQTVPNQTLTALQNLAKGTNIASAGTTNIAAATGNYVHVTGTTTITALGTAQGGAERVVVFDGILTLTHNGTSLILPTGASITTAAGDVAGFVSEGSGNWKCVFYQRADGSAVAGGGGGLTGFTSALNTASPNNTVNASSLTAQGGTTNQDAVVSPKGTGALIAQIPDGTTTAGNKRGTGATDWQKNRTNAAQVASGNGATIGGGINSTSSANQTTVAGGANNQATGNFGTVGGGNTNVNSSVSGTISGGANNAANTNQGTTIGGGEDNVASGIRATVAGGYFNISNGGYSGTYGGLQGNARSTYGAAYWSSGQFAASGDAQHRSFVFRSDTTNATPEAVSADNSAASASNQIVLPNNAAFMVKGTVVCRENATGDTSAWEFTVLIKRGANAAATALVAAATISAPIQDAGAATWTLGITANTTLGGLTITVTGEAAHNIKWVTDVYSCNEVVG